MIIIVFLRSGSFANWRNHLSKSRGGSICEWKLDTNHLSQKMMIFIFLSKTSRICHKFFRRRNHFIFMNSIKFKYAAVARGATPLAEHSLVTGNHRTIAIRMLENIDPKTQRAVVEQNQGVFTAITEPDRVSFVVLTDKSVRLDGRLAFLNDLKQRWRGRYGNSAAGFAPNSKNAEFGSTEMAALMRNYNSASFQKISTIQENLSEAQDQMTQNLTMALARHEQLSMMEEKAENIKESASTFKRTASQVRRHMCLQRWKWYFIGVAIALVVIFIIVWVACGASFQKCRKSA